MIEVRTATDASSEHRTSSEPRPPASRVEPDGARKICLVVNPGARGADRLGELLLQLPGVPIEVCVAPDPSHIPHLVRSAAERSFDRLLIAGGDGTISQVVTALVPDFPDVELGILPLGTGNDLARSLGLSEDLLNEAGRAAIDAPAISIDVVRCELDGHESVFHNVANGGFGGRVARAVNQQSKDVVGTLAYWLAGAAAVASPEMYEVELKLDGVSLQQSVIGVAVANGRFVGGGFPIAPEAWLCDGLLDITMIPSLSTLEMLAAGTRYALAGDAADSPADLLRSKTVELHSAPGMPFSIDGELAVVHEARFEVLPAALRVVAGAPCAQIAPDHASSRRNDPAQSP